MSHFLTLTMFWPRPEKVFKKKSWLFPNKYQSLKKFWVIFLVKTHFWPKKHFSAKRKNIRFSVNPSRTGSVVILGHFFDGPDGSTKFGWKQTKIKDTYTFVVTQAKSGQKQGRAPKNDS